MIKSNFLAGIQKKIDKLDITTIKNIIFELIDENNNLKNVFNSMKEAVIVLDNKLNIFFYNKMAVKILELTKDFNKQTNFKTLETDNNLVSAILSVIQKEEIIENFEIMTNDNIPKYYSISFIPFVEKGKISGNVLIIEDITNYIQFKNKLRQAENLAALTTISAGIAHEIKNPLGAIGIHLQLIEHELKNIKTENNLKFSFNIVKEELDRLNNIINDYLITVRPLNSQLMLVNMNIFLDNLIDFIKPELKAYDVRIIKDYKNLPDLWIDEKFFKQALLNLIKNSLESIKENGIIKISCYKKQNYVYINIIDNGEGIPEDMKTKIFDPYFTTKTSGTGLGLTIVYKIIKEHKGDIYFKSKKGETIFTIKLPLSQIQEGLIEYTGENDE